MVEFDLIQSNSPPELIANNIFLAKSANWKMASIGEISSRIPEVDLICRAINEQFNIKVRPWQVDVVVDITKRKQNVCIIADINVGKSLVYQ